MCSLKKNGCTEKLLSSEMALGTKVNLITSSIRQGNDWFKGNKEVKSGATHVHKDCHCWIIKRKISPCTCKCRSIERGLNLGRGWKICVKNYCSIWANTTLHLSYDKRHNFLNLARLPRSFRIFLFEGHWHSPNFLKCWSLSYPQFYWQRIIKICLQNGCRMCILQ